MSVAHLLAWSVHGLTALGAVVGFLAALAVQEGQYRNAFGWLLGATLIDCVDGWLARRFRANELAPALNGARLDDIVDYLTFVFVPALLLLRAGCLPEGWGIAVASAILLSSAYGFSHEAAKTDDHFFTGFPSYWNIVAFYVYAAGTPPALNGVLIVALAILVFVPVVYVYPSRTPTLRMTTVALAIAWGGLILVALVRLPQRSPLLLAGSLAFPVYYATLSAVLHLRRAKAAPSPSGQPIQ
jgi:phosphatidylcholine synthase